MNSVGYDRSSHSGLHSPPPNSSYQFLSDCGARRQAIDLFVLSPHLFPPHPVASALQGRVVPLKVKLGGNGPTGQSSGGAGQGPGAGSYVQARRDGMEPRDATGAGAAPPLPPSNLERPKSNHPSFPGSGESPGLRNPGHRCIPGRTRASPAHPQTTAVRR